MAEKKRVGGAIVRRGVTVLLALILICAVMFVITVNWIDVRAKEEQTVPALFGYGFVPITADVAQEPFVRGDLVLTSQNGEYAAGDCILIENTADIPKEEQVDGRFLLARILAENDGSFQIVTRTSSPQLMTILPEQVLGDVTHVVKGVGMLFDFVRMPVGFFVMILAPFFVLIVWIAILSFLAHRRRIREAAEEDSEAEKADGPVLQVKTINENVPITAETFELQTDRSSEKTASPKCAAPTEKTEPIVSKKEEPQPSADVPKEKLVQQSPKTDSLKSSHLDYEKSVDAWIDELMAEISVPDSKPSVQEPPAMQTEAIEPKTPSDFPEIKKEQGTGTMPRPSFMDMTTDEIIEQFTMELEEARLRPLDEIKSDEFDGK